MLSVSEYPDGSLGIRICVEPVPASRMRHTRNGGRGYYGKRYTAFRKRLAEILQDYEYPPLTGPLSVDTWLYMPYPKTVKRAYPRGDNDNYEKAVWDCLNEKVWEDDEQIVSNFTLKAFSEDPVIILHVRPIEGEYDPPEPDEVLP